MAEYQDEEYTLRRDFPVLASGRRQARQLPEHAPAAREVVTDCICGQLPELEPLQRLCEACGAEPGEACAPDCIGLAAHADELAEAGDMAGEPHPDAVYGACGVEGCLRCRPLFDAANQPIPGTEG